MLAIGVSVGDWYLRRVLAIQLAVCWRSGLQHVGDWTSRVLATVLVRVGDQSRELMRVGDQSHGDNVRHFGACWRSEKVLAIRSEVCWRLEARDLLAIGDRVRSVLAIMSEMCWRWCQRSVGDRSRCTQPHPIVLRIQPTPTRRRPPRTRAAPLASRSAPSHLPSCRFRVAPPLVPPLEPHSRSY